MQKLIYLILACSLAIPAMAAPAPAKKNPARKITVEKPDFARIERETQDPKSDLYFPKLIKIYNRNDKISH